MCVMKLYVLAELIEKYGATLAQAVPRTVVFAAGSWKWNVARELAYPRIVVQW